MLFLGVLTKAKAKTKNLSIMPPKRVKKVMTIPINVIFGYLQFLLTPCNYSRDVPRFLLLLGKLNCAEKY